MAGLASVGLIVAIINILNLILASIERTKSIGLSLAIGSSRRMIFQQFLWSPSFRAIGCWHRRRIVIWV